MSEKPANQATANLPLGGSTLTAYAMISGTSTITDTGDQVQIEVKITDKNKTVIFDNTFTGNITGSGQPMITPGNPSTLLISKEGVLPLTVVGNLKYFDGKIWKQYTDAEVTTTELVNDKTSTMYTITGNRSNSEDTDMVKVVVGALPFRK